MNVKIYTTTTCPFCRMEKEYLDAAGIKYENIYVDEDQAAAQELINTSHQLGVPFTVVTKDDGSKENILGFDKTRLKELFHLS
ncbi:MAG TPA: glutaredoxin family protein [Candidatus Nanoarchaeia archaeon]|nr:hypothetical protein [uncultured archaeon]